MKVSIAAKRPARLFTTAFFLLLFTQVFSQDKFETGFDMVWCGDSKITFDYSCREPEPGIYFIHVHENETTAVDAAKTMLDKYKKGCFVTWKSNGERYVKFNIGKDTFKFDPNRIYTAKGRAATLKANGAYTSVAEAKVKGAADVFLQKYVDSQRLVVALHNNTDAGGLTIHSFEKKGDYAKDAKKVFVSKTKDEDDFFLTTEIKIFEYIKKRGFNILLQDNAKVTDDGSLSVYAAKKKIPYLNVEAQAGHLEEQQKMLDVVQDMIKALYE